MLYSAPDLTVINVVWPPLFSLYPHDHRMWAAICIYRGREDNAFTAGAAIRSSARAARNYWTATCSCLEMT